VVQEASLALHRAIEREPERFAEPEHARNYFLRTVRNLAQKSRRDERPAQPLAGELPAADAGDPEARAIARRQRALARILLELPPGARELIARRYLEHRTLAEIARETGVAISTLHDRERALLAELRARISVLERELEREEVQ